MMTTTKNRILALAAATTLGLTLASCSDPEAPVDEPTAEDAPADDATVEEETTEEDAPSDDAAGDDAAAAGPECLIGTWEMTPESLQEQTAATLGDGAEVTAEGTTTVVFEADTMTNTSDASTTFSGEVEGVETEGSTMTDGTYTIEYSADDTNITYGEVVSAEGSTVTEQTVDGTAVDTEITFEEATQALAQVDQTYECSADELTVTTSAGGIDIPITYSRG